MAPGVAGIEGSTHGHDVIPVKNAVNYLSSRGYPDSILGIYDNIKPYALPYVYVGSTKENVATRAQFGDSVVKVLDAIGKEEAAKKVMVIDSKWMNITRGIMVSWMLCRRLGGFHWPESHSPEAP